MTERQDRRAVGINRVSVARLVDICGRDPSVPAFEAQSIELSGRGMHVRTPFLPPLGAPLVCRLEDGGREIVVEGVVAWQKDRQDGGEFGVQFTALDSGSVEALKSLCGLGTTDDDAPAKERFAAPEASSVPRTAGVPVKLHIDGLGAPMKARIRSGGSRRLQVGSNLEFLKVGRGLEVEDVEQGERRGARIDAVSIAIDPQTQVPQLVVALRYDGEDTTPEPSVIGAEEHAGGSRREPLEAAMHEAVSASDDDSPEGSDDDDETAAAMRGKVDAFAVSVGKAAKNTGDKLAGASSTAAAGFAKWAKLGGARLVEIAQRRSASPKRRATAKAPVSPTPAAQRKLRPQNSQRDDADESQPNGTRRKAIAAAGGVAVLSLTIGAFAFAGHSSKEAPPSSVPAALPPLAALATSPQATPQSPLQMGLPPVPNAMALAPNTLGVATQNAAVPGARPGVVANVPLFGPTPMATLEPAPLGPSPDEIASAPPQAAPRATEERMEEEDVKARDEAFSDGSKDDKSDKSDKGEDEKAAAVKPWGTGKLHLPVLHRLKLDKPGADLEGKKEEGGFSIVIPGRKVLDGGTSISKRDDRIADVRTKNGPGGAHITFVFRSKVPGYKVRLRKSYVEFLISSPDSLK